MKKVLLLSFAAGLFSIAAQAQTLFTYGSQPVSRAEFLRVYQKNALNKKPDFSDTALHSYLDLYSVFRMKVAEAEAIKLDTAQSIARELDNYRRQLARTYLTDQQVTTSLVREAYDRMKEEVRVAHIMIAMPPGAADTARQWARIDSIYQAATKQPAKFEELAKAVSEDKGSKDRGGELGYITGMQTIYPFESAAFNTPKGAISKPFRTQFGYHVLKVLDRRPARGEVRVAQILISTPKSAGDSGVAFARKRLDSLQRDLKAGKSWDDLVEKYSDDKFTKADKGVMQPFGVGRMAPPYEKAAFDLKKPGDISQPVQTDYGFHVIKLIERLPVKPYDSIKDALKRRVENDSRAQLAQQQYLNGVKQKHSFKEMPDALRAIESRMTALPDTGKMAGSFDPRNYGDMNQPLFTLAGESYRQSDFINFMAQTTRGRLSGNRARAVGDLYKMYVERTINDYEEHHLADNNEDFRNLMEEYRNGIMLFELMDRNVWGKAGRDTVGLQAFYDQHKSKYTWEPGFTGAIYRFKTQDAANKAATYTATHPGAKDEDVLAEVNSGATLDAATVQRGRYEYNQYKDIPQGGFKVGMMTNPVKNTDGSYTAILPQTLHAARDAKTLDEARGYVVADYQDYLEKQWVAELRAKYPVKVDEAVFKSMVKK